MLVQPHLNLRIWSIFALISVALTAPLSAEELFTEDFEAVTLMPIVTFESEPVIEGSRAAWQSTDDADRTGFPSQTPSGAAGWTEVNLTPSVGDNNLGVTEFEGWRFVDKNWWINTAGGQLRQEFINGVGVIAVADPDEWDDFGDPTPSESSIDPLSSFDSTLKTPAISIAGVGSETVKLNFSSSWRPEDVQVAKLTAVYDVGDPEELDAWSSVVADPDFKDDATNENLTYELQAIPEGATEVTFEFQLQGNNDWWWAIDNVRVFTGDEPSGTDAVLRAIIDRDLGSVRIVNNTGVPVDLRGYSFRSIAGAFDEAAATFLADTDSDWIQTTQIGDSVNDLSEVHITSDTLAADGEINLGDNDIWIKYFEEAEDVSFSYLVDGSDEQVTGILEFANTPGESFAFLDLNFDGNVDLGDWSAFLAITDTADLSDLTTAQAYQKGDLDADGRLGVGDFVTFQREFDSLMGAGAFAAMVSGAPVPEPSTVVMLSAGCVGLLIGQRRAISRRRAIVQRFAHLALLAVAGMLIAVPPASAQRLSDGVGVTEWEEWSFADKDWWAETAGDQDRTLFTNASGVIAIADPDEWDDIGGPGDDRTFNSQLRSPQIDISGIDPTSLTLSFASSWRDEDTQGASLDVFYDGIATEVFRWSSEAEDPNFKDDAPDELINISLPNAGAATTMQLGFNLFNATNDWWWAIDNVDVQANTGTVLFEDFESVSLGPSIDEEIPEEDVFSQDGPEGWVVNTDNYQPPIGLIAERHVDTITRLPPPPEPATLRMEVNTVTGFVKLVSIAEDQVVLTGYTVSSEGGALSDSDWLATNLDARGVDAGGTGDSDSWETVIATSELVYEAFLNGNTTIDPDGSLIIGKLYNSSIGGEDLSVSYSYIATDDFGQTVFLSSEETFPPVDVTYADVVVEGDYNGDGAVNLADYTVWRDNLGGTGLLNEGIGISPGAVDAADYTFWKQNFGATAESFQASTGAPVPEPAGLLLAACGMVAVGRRRFTQLAYRTLGLLLAAVLWCGPRASAQLPPSPLDVGLDRFYQFGDDDDSAVAGQPITQNVNGTFFTRDTAGEFGMRQKVSLEAVPTVRPGFDDRLPTYTSTADRPGASAGDLGILLNQSGIDRQYLRTGFGGALNYPEQSLSSIFTLLFAEPGTINYNFINNRGFEIWVQPGVVTGEHHIVMDSNQHGVLIKDGVYQMRYASQFNTVRDPGPDEIEGTADDIVIRETVPADYASDVPATAGQWAHLSVVRPLGPDNGSIFYVNGVAEAIGFGAYAGETIVNEGEGLPITDIDLVDISPLTVGARTDAEVLDLDQNDPANNFYFRGVVDDLKMFVMGFNDDDNVGNGTVNVINDYGEFIVQRDNGYIALMGPTVDGDLNGDDMVTLADATLFAGNWLSEKVLSGTDPSSGAMLSRFVGDLETRALGDFDYNGIVDLEDWAILNNANPTAGAAALRLISGAVIPEPSSLLLVCLATGGVWGLKRLSKGNRD